MSLEGGEGIQKAEMKRDLVSCFCLRVCFSSRSLLSLVDEHRQKCSHRDRPPAAHAGYVTRSVAAGIDFFSLFAAGRESVKAHDHGLTWFRFN